MSVIWTNRMNLPQTFKNAITTDNHVVNGDISVTQLMDAPQIRSLKKNNDYEMDILDMVGMFVGTATHDYLEKLTFSSNYRARVLEEAAGIIKGFGDDKAAAAAAWITKAINEKFAEKIDDDVVMEQTLSMEVDGMVISGTFDRFIKSTGTLEDYKTTSANSMMFPETKTSYNAQLNIYAVLMRANGFDVKSARIIAILKDWSKMKIMTNRDYPREPIVMMNIPLLDDDVVMKYIRKRIALHKRADGGENIPCTKKDRWAKPDVFRIFKADSKGKRRRSLQNNTTMKDAQKFVSEKEHKYPKGLVIEHTKPSSFRCENGYCSMAGVCPQYQEEKKLAAKEAENM